MRTATISIIAALGNLALRIILRVFRLVWCIIVEIACSVLGILAERPHLPDQPQRGQRLFELQVSVAVGTIAEAEGDKWIIGRGHKTMVSTNRPMVNTNHPNIPFQLKLMDVLVSECFYIRINWNLYFNVF